MMMSINDQSCCIRNLNKVTSLRRSHTRHTFIVETVSHTSHFQQVSDRTWAQIVERASATAAAKEGGGCVAVVADASAVAAVLCGSLGLSAHRIAAFK